MNNKRLSTSAETSLSEVGREQLYLEINKLLNGPSNIEVKEEGRLFIKSLNSYYKGSGKTKVQIIDKKGLVFKTFISLSDCAKFLAPLRRLRSFAASQGGFLNLQLRTD
jgi:hypothetical protein